MKKNFFRIAIDGPAGAGKSTVAKLLSKKFDIDYIDTGAMYRALALKLLRSDVDFHNDEELRRVLDCTNIDFSKGSIYLDGECVDGLIRTPEVSALASESSAVPYVRERLVAIQQRIAGRKGVVMDGRDIASVVLPDAEFKFYLDASSRVRAKRRTLELQEKGIDADIDKIEDEIKKRDYNDMHRACSPLVKTEDAIVIDSSYLSIEETAELMESFIILHGRENPRF